MPESSTPRQPESRQEKPPPRHEEQTDVIERPEPADQKSVPGEKEKVWSILAHLAVFVAPVFGPLLILGLQDQIFDQRSEYLGHSVRQAVAWQIATLLIGIVTFGLGFVVMIVWSILATIATNRGERYVYPLVGERAKRLF